MNEPKPICKNKGGDITALGECGICHAVAGETCREEPPMKVLLSGRIIIGKDAK